MSGYLDLEGKRALVAGGTKGDDHRAQGQGAAPRLRADLPPRRPAHPRVQKALGDGVREGRACGYDGQGQDEEGEADAAGLRSTAHGRPQHGARGC